MIAEILDRLNEEKVRFTSNMNDWEWGMNRGLERAIEIVNEAVSSPDPED